MGTRGNVYVHEGDNSGVYLYQHWGADSLDAVVAYGLGQDESRWNDTPYLTRILFCTMLTGGREISPLDALAVLRGTTGFGIDATLGDGGDRIVDVDTSKGTVRALDGTVRTIAEHVKMFSA